MATTAHTAHPAHIRRASADDLPRVAATLAAALFDDPVFRRAYPDDERRRELLPGFFFSLFAEAMLRHGETYTAADISGAALWAPPGSRPSRRRRPRSSAGAWERCRERTPRAGSGSAS